MKHPTQLREPNVLTALDVSDVLLAYYYEKCDH